MIVKMKKVSLVVLNREKKESLNKLRKLGLVHLETLEGESEKLSNFKELSSETEKAISILSDVKIPKKEKIKSVKLKAEDIPEKIKSIISLSEKKKSLFDLIMQDSLELQRLEKWGSVNIDDLKYLAEKNIFLYLYEIPQDKYTSIPNDLNTILVNENSKVARFILFSEEELLERPHELPAEAYSVVLPRDNTDNLIKDINSNKNKISEIEKELYSSLVYLDSIKSYKKILLSDIEFENIYSGMSCEEDCDEYNSLAWLSGYVPVDSFEKFKTACFENQWAYAAADPNEEDLVPTKLKNNKFVSLIYPLTDFLGTVPGYNEYDISGWFLFYFSIFFGMIFGDGGYGILLTVAVLFLMIKNLFTGKKNPPLLPLGLILGISTMIWGLVTCTWFGLLPEQLPEWLKELSLRPISSAYPKAEGELSTDQNLQIFCFSLALLQLTVAHIKGMITNRKSLKIFGELGSMLQLWGMFYIVLTLVVSSEFFAISKVVYNIPIGYVSIALIAVGFILSFIFANYDGSVIASILESLKGIITVLLGVVNIFSDIISYIRLWAVGLAGAAISNTINSMAGPMIGHAIMFVFALLLLCGGHGLNMVLNLLSVIVHGVRLNTLEFSSHLGMSWSGIKYSPFAEMDIKNNN